MYHAAPQVQAWPGTPAAQAPTQQPYAPSPYAPSPPGMHPTARPSNGIVVAGWILFGLGVVLWILGSAMPVPLLAGVMNLLLIVLVIACAVMVYSDANKLGVDRIALARIKTTSTERTSSAVWGVCVFFLWIVCLPWYLAIRNRLAVRVAQANQFGWFGTKQEAKAARRTFRSLPAGTPYPQ